MLKKYIHIDSKYKTMEICILIGISVLATVSFCFVYDLWHTSNCSLAYLQGHFSDFYDYNVNERHTGTIVYFPTIYIIFAIWNIPLRLVCVGGGMDITYNSSGALLWSKGLGILFLILCYWAVYHISLLLSEDKKTAKRSLIIMALSMPAFFLFEFSWGLYDTVWLAFLLIGIWQLIKGTKKHIIIAAACFAIAVTLKMFVLFLIVPILCYKIKNIGYLILSGIGTMSLYVLELFLYRESDYFINNVINPLNGGFLFNLLWGAAINGISVFLTIFLIACIYGYITKDNHLIGFIYIPFVTGIMFAAISHQTPGWHVIYMPFLAVLISYLKIHERKICYLCNAAISIGIIIYTLTTRGCWFGETSLGAGIFGKWIFGVKNAVDNCLVRASSFYTAKLYGQSSITDNIVINYAGTVIFAVALFLCIYLYNNSNFAL